LTLNYTPLLLTITLTSTIWSTKSTITNLLFDWLLVSAVASCCELINGLPLMASAFVRCSSSVTMLLLKAALCTAVCCKRLSADRAQVWEATLTLT